MSNFGSNWRAAKEPSTLEDFRAELVGWERWDWDPEIVAELQVKAQANIENQRERCAEILSSIADGSAHESDRKYAANNLEELRNWTSLELCPPAIPAPALAKITWERAVGDARWIAGFIDVHAEIGSIYDVGLVKTHTEVKVYNDGHLNLPALVAQCRTTRAAVYSDESAERFAFSFEAKVTMPTLGDLVRQIRFYEAKDAQVGAFYVVSSDTRFIAPLQGQGIGFVEYPSGEITHPKSS